MLFSLTSCQFAGFEIRKVDANYILLEDLYAGNKDVGDKVIVDVTLQTTERKEWAKLCTGKEVYVKKGAINQAFEYDVNYIVDGTVMEGNIPFGKNKFYIEADDLLKKSD